MNDPTVVRICACGHPERLHSEEFGCDNTVCGCTSFREGSSGVVDLTPRAAPPAAVRPAASTVHRVPPAAVGPTADQLVAAGRRSTVKATAALAEKIERQLVELRQRLRDERETADASARRVAAIAAAERDVERLERELAEARARLKALKHRTPPRGQDHYRPPRVHARRLRPLVRHRPGTGDARTPGARRIRPASCREGRVSV